MYTGISAAHYELEVDQGYSRWMGFLIECNGVTIYHSGDTVVIPELRARSKVLSATCCRARLWIWRGGSRRGC